MEIVNFDEVRDIIINSMKRKMLIPILGSGFSRGCSALRGTVPSGEEYQSHMINAIRSHGDFTPDEMDALCSAPFSSVSGIYHDVVPVAAQREYLEANFTKVVLDSPRQKLLSVSWPYIYTLNIDDAIERNSGFENVIYSNRPVQKTIFDECKCVVKLHGDVKEILNYEDTISEIFDQTQYVASLHQNTALLSKLTHDISYQNLLYIGCSLSDEIDLLSASITSIPNENTRFFCTAKNPSRIDMIKLSRYKITHCIVFSSYQEMYNLIYEAALEAEKISHTEIDRYRIYKFTSLDDRFKTNKPYLFHGKSLINKKDRSISLPYFFISRKVTSKLIKNLRTCSIQFLLGSGCSGKTYIAIDVAYHVRDRDVFMFESKESLSDTALQSLLKHNNRLIIADSNSLNIRQIEELIKSKDQLKQKNISFLIAESKNNRDLAGLIQLLELNHIIEPGSIPKIDIPNKFSREETLELNKRLTTATLGVFSEKKSIADNIIDCSRDLIQNSRFDKISPLFNDERQIACLIALAIENKIYSSRAVELDLLPEIYKQELASKPLIEVESTWSFETAPSNSSPLKYVANAEYWLNAQLCEFSKAKANKDLIIQAYRHIISRLVSIYGKPDLTYGDKYAQYKPYILFDNINQIFRTEGLVLIRGIYENLNDLLSSDPNYMHQRAKCYIRSARLESDTQEKQKFLEKAYRDASVSHSVFKKRYEDTGYPKLQISIAHIEYTKALVLCHQANLDRYQDVSENTKAVEILYQALLSPYNSYDFIKSDIYNYDNVVMNLITALISNSSLAEKKVHPLLADLFKKVKTDPEV